LTRLRIPAKGFQSQWSSSEDQPYFCLLQMNSLTMLELYNGASLNDASMAAIGKMRNLKRMQLPFSFEHDAPEEFPYAFEEVLNQAKFARQLRSRIEGSYAYRPPHDNRDGLAMIHVSQDGVAKLAQLQQLEYLLLPRYLLDDHSIKIIGSLPKLTELHALFSLTSPEQLEQVSQLSQLKKLSIGILVDDADAILEFCGIMQQLEFLQLFAMDTEGKHQPLKGQLTGKIEQLLPDAAVHVIFFPGR